MSGLNSLARGMSHPIQPSVRVAVTSTDEGRLHENLLTCFSASIYRCHAVVDYRTAGRIAAPAKYRRTTEMWWKNPGMVRHGRPRLCTLSYIGPEHAWYVLRSHPTMDEPGKASCMVLVSPLISTSLIQLAVSHLSDDARRQDANKAALFFTVSISAQVSCSQRHLFISFRQPLSR